jgi:hypothetical protein
MDVFLFEVEEVLTLSEARLGPVLYPGIGAGSLPLTVGTSILLLLPDGAHIETTFSGFPLINRKAYRDHVPIELPQNLRNVEIPIGTQVWLMGNHEAT